MANLSTFCTSPFNVTCVENSSSILCLGDTCITYKEGSKCNFKDIFSFNFSFKFGLSLLKKMTYLKNISYVAICCNHHTGVPVDVV